MSETGVKFTIGDPLKDTDEYFEPPAPLLAGAHVSGMKSYQEMYEESINDSDKFWKTVAEQLYFERKSSKGLEWNFDPREGKVFVRFMEGAKTNIAYNCLERNISHGYGSQTAFIWEGNEPGDSYSITFQDLLDKVVIFSAVLRKHGVRKGDVVAIYLPMILELPIAMLACARIGAVHSVIFAGYGANALATRVSQAKACLIVTCDVYFRGSKMISSKAIVNQALDMFSPQVVYKANRDFIWNDEMNECSNMESAVEWCESEDPLFVLYTSGSTGKPKGLVHATAGYMVYTYATTKYVFDARNADVFWCTADCGWITGHSFVVYGTLLNGMTSVIFEGIPTYPSASRLWEVVEKYKVNTLYTSPTVIRLLMGKGEGPLRQNDKSSLRILASAGEPIDPKAWKWFYTEVGGNCCAVLDTYWQTEAGGPMITPIPGATVCKPGSATLPFFGIKVALLDKNGVEIRGPGEGNLCFKAPWPSLCRTVLGDSLRYESTYFAPYPGYFFTGDGARRDEDGYIWITGRVDDLINVSGHLLSTAEIESALALDDDVVEVAVVAAPHDIKGSFPYAFVRLRDGKRLTEEKVVALKTLVRKKISPIAVPDVIQSVPGLPKTRSGKTPRRILRKVAEGDVGADLGDTSTLINPKIIRSLWDSRRSCKSG
ncbi:unnamed protein product [Enterobius vermicularis]|uniref:Acetyl-coenzyme A synthetase n=1 Tax=Enterobius vermicularis TaxID=51028 RepID=A0A0N4VK95_ENTVE|nr:unnamed protein product [Enterobius vermicularis]